MKQHLALIAARTKPGRHAVVIMDGAGWHTMECADDFPNLSLIKLLPILPNSIPLNRYGAGFVSMCWLIAASRIDDILMPASAWKHFIADVERVMSLCSRDWINDLMFNRDWYHLEEYDYAGASAIASVMLLISFVLLLLINKLQSLELGSHRRKPYMNASTAHLDQAQGSAPATPARHPR